ncbi:MAG TPA: hypothetical protein VFZ10_10185 [Geminicoccaceae bacterium]
MERRAMIGRIAVLKRCSSDGIGWRMDRHGFQGALVERCQELPQGPELHCLGLGQQRIDKLIFTLLDRHGYRVAKLGCARLRSFEQPHSLEQNLVTSNNLCEHLRQALRRHILPPENLKHAGDRILTQVELGAERAYAGVAIQNRAAGRAPGQGLQIHSAEGPLDDRLEFGRSGPQGNTVFCRAAGRNAVLVCNSILAQRITGLG